jgi:hypothetical protein
MDRSNPGQKIAEVRIGRRAFYFFIVPLSFVTILAIKWLAEHWLGTGDPEWTRKELWGFFAFSLVVAVVHESLHAFALFYWGRVPVKEIKFGCTEFMPYCSSSGPVEVQAFRVVLLLPFVCTSLLALTCLWMYPSNWMAIFTGFTISTNFSDILTFIKIRPFSGNCFLTNHPILGFEIFAPPAEARMGSEQKASGDPDCEEPS